MVEVVIELDVSVYVRCEHAAAAAGMSLQEWIRQAVERYLEILASDYVTE